MRYDLDRKCVNDLFEVGRSKLKNVVVERQKELAKEERKLRLIYDAVAFFQKGKAQ